MKGLKAVSRATQAIKGWSDRIPLYYSVSKDTVYLTEGDGRSLVTYLINPNTEKDVLSAVERWLRM